MMFHALTIPILLLAGVPSTDAPEVSVDIVNAAYCTLPDGRMSLELRLDIKYRNDSVRPLILPRLIRTSGYRLFRSGNSVGSNVAIQSAKFKVFPDYDDSLRRSSVPDPALFEFIVPGSTGHRIANASIPVTGPHARCQLGHDYLLQVDVANWPAKQKLGLSLQRDWAKQGLLWTEMTVLPAVRIHLDETPKAEPCSLRG